MIECLGIVDGVLLLAQQEDSARSIGRLCGGVFWPLLMLAGVVKCIQIAGRKEASALCAWALALVFLGWGIATAANVASKMIDTPELSHLVQYFGIGVMLLLSITSLVLAIIGLVQYRGYTQGRAQAIWALSLNGLVVALFLGGAVVGAMSALSDRPQGVPNQPAAGEAIAFDQFNFRCALPSERWVRMSAEAINEDATVALRRNNPEVIWMVIAEQFGDNPFMDNQALAQIAKSNGVGAADSARYTDPEPTTLGGLPALRMTSQAVMDGRDFSYDYRILVHNGYAYQIICFSEAKSRREMEKEAQAVADTFALLDPDRVATGESMGQAVDRLALPEAGLALDLPAGWLSWDELDIDYPDASVGALMGYNGALAVVALPMDGIETTDRLAAQALLETMDMTIDGPEVLGSDPVEVGGLQGLLFDAERETDSGPMRYRLAVLRNARWAYLLAGWAVSDRPELAEQIESIFRQAEIDADAPARALPAKAEAHAELYNSLAIDAYHQGQYRLALAGFLKARDTDPANETYTDNVIDTYEELGQYREAVALGEAHLAEYPDHHEARANVAYQLTYVDGHDNAIAHYARSFAAGFRSDFYLVDYVVALRHREQADEALAVLDRYASAEGANTDLTIERCRAWADTGQHAEAIALLEDRCAAALPDPRLRAEWVRALTRADEARAAAELGQRLTEDGDPTAELWFVRGLAEMELEWYPKARASFQKATELGSDTSYREHLDYVAGLLGRGDNTLVRTPVEPVDFPASLIEGVTPHPEAEQHKSHIEYDVNAYYFRPGRPNRHTFTQRVVITGPEALEEWSTLDADFDSQYERVFVNNLTVTDAAGNIVARGDLDTYFVIDQQRDGIASDDKTLNIPVPGLAVGHTIDVTISYETLGAKDEFAFRQHRFVSSYAVGRRAVVVDASDDHFAFEASDGVTSTSTDDVRGWSVDAPAVYRWEPFLPDIDTIFPMVTLAPNERTWAGVARDYLDDLAGVLNPPPDFDPSAREILGDATDPSEVIERATRHVQRHLTYEAIEFGVRGIIPHTLEQITQQRFGDCKDHALWLYHLLRAGGVEAHLATVQTDGPIVESLPTLGQFNHMVVYVPAPAPGSSADEGGADASGVGGNASGGGLVLDATDKSHAPLAGTPVGVQQRPLLVLDPDQPRLVTDTPRSADNDFQTQRDVRITDTGDAVVREVLTATGPWAEGLLEYLRGKAGDDLLSRVQDSLDVEDGLRLTSVTTSDLTDLAAPLTVTLDYTIPAAFERQPQAWFGRLPAPWEVYYLSPGFVPQRRHDFERQVGFTFRSVARVSFPEGVTLAQPPPPASVENPAVAAKVESTVTAAGLEMAAEIRLPPGRYPAGEYAAYERQLSGALRALRPTLHLQAAAE